MCQKALTLLSPDVGFSYGSGQLPHFCERLETSAANLFTNHFYRTNGVDTGKLPPASVFSTNHSLPPVLLSRIQANDLHHSSRPPYQMTTFLRQWNEHVCSWFGLPVPSFSRYLCLSPGTQSFLVCVDSDWIIQRSET